MACQIRFKLGVNIVGGVDRSSVGLVMGSNRDEWIKARHFGTGHSDSVSLVKGFPCTAREDPSLKAHSSQKLLLFHRALTYFILVM